MNITFAKGHGTGNDFVIIADPTGNLPLSPHVVQRLCDRRFGIGGDGVLRVVQTERASYSEDLEIVSAPGAPIWFMDYWNADGTTASMCGNGIRVFARYLVDFGYARAGRIEILTRGGIRVVHVPPRGDIEVDMGAPVYRGFPEQAVITLAQQKWAASALGMPNPHAVVWLDSLHDLPTELPAPEFSPLDFPQGVNVEFAQLETDVDVALHVRMRVVERGSGETLSCGTGACAVGVSALARQHRDRGQVRVDLPGGRLVIELTSHGNVLMTGPAEIVATGNIRPELFHQQLPASRLGSDQQVDAGDWLM